MIENFFKTALRLNQIFPSNIIHKMKQRHLA